MEKFCDFITNPAWWSVIATILAAIVAAVITYVLGRRQNELQQQQVELQRQQTRLQEQQTKAQEYEVYKHLYSVVKEINRESEELLNRFYQYFASSAYKDIFRMAGNQGVIGWLYARINELDNRLDSYAIDFELKLAGDTTDLHHYQTLVDDMRLMTQAMERFEKLQIIVFREEEGVNALMLTYRGEKDALINGICDRVAVEKYKDAIRKDLENYLLVRKQVMEHNTLDKIKQRIMPIDTK